MSITPDDPRLTAYVLDELAPEERNAFERDLADDPTAQGEVEALHALLPSLTQALAHEPALTSDAPAQALAAAFPLRVRRIPWGRLAAVLVVGLGLGVGLHALTRPATVVLEERRSEEARLPAGKDASRVLRDAAMDGIPSDNDVPLLPGPEATPAGLALPTAPPSGALPTPTSLQPLQPDLMGLPSAPGPAADPGGIGVAGGGNGGVIMRLRRDEGIAPTFGAPTGGDDHGRLTDEGWKRADVDHTSTFSLDVDTASLAIVRRSLREGRLPPPDAVRIEELINAFDYDYAAPETGSQHPLRVHGDVVGCPWAPSHRLVRLALKAREVDARTRPPLHLVFLIDVSGSMQRADRLPLAQHALGLLLTRLEPRDRLAIVTYAGSSRLVLPSTSCAERETIQAAIDGLTAGGGTNGADGLRMAYEQAREAPAEDGAIRRVLLLTDGDFNIGVSDTGTLETQIADQAATGVWLSVFGFGMGNLKDDRLERLSNRGNGTYAYIDTIAEAQRVLVDDMLGTMITVAKDAKIQVFFNPARVGSWRLIGYANRKLAARDFNDDRKDAGDVGSGHQVTALYEVVPVGVAPPAGTVDANPFVDEGAALPPASPAASPTEGETADPEAASAARALLRWRARAKAPKADVSMLQEGDLVDSGQAFPAADADLQWAAGVAAFGEWLRGNPALRGMGLDGVLEILTPVIGIDRERLAFLQLVRRAAELSGR